MLNELRIKPEDQVWILGMSSLIKFEASSDDFRSGAQKREIRA